MKYSVQLVAAILLLALRATTFAGDLSTTNREALTPFVVAVEKQQRPITVLSFGDSIANSYESLSFILMNQLGARLGFAGYAMNNYRNTTLYAISGGTQVLTTTARWYSSYLQMPPGGSL